MPNTATSVIPTVLRKYTVSILVTVSAIITYVTTLSYIQDKLIYHPRSYTREYAALLQHPYVHQFSYNTQHCGTQTSFIVRDNNAHNDTVQRTKIVLCFGGNAGLALDWMPFIHTFYHSQAYTQHSAHTRYIFVLVDYVGYGINKRTDLQARITPNNILDCTVSACNQVLQLYNQPNVDITMMAHSLGAAASVQMYHHMLQHKLDNNIKSLLLLSPFTSIYDMSVSIFGFAVPLIELLLKHKYNNRQRLQYIVDHSDVHVDIYHGAHDDIVPVEQGRELGNLTSRTHSKCTLQYHEYKCYHNDIIDYIAPQLCNKLTEQSAPSVQSPL